MSVTSAAIGRARSAVLRACDDVGTGGGDTRELRLRVLTQLRRALAFDAYVWQLTDPETTVGVAPLADVPPELMPALPQLIALKYRTAANRWTSLDSAATLLASTDGDPSRSLLWRDLLGPAGITDVASVVFRDRYGCWSFLDLWRREGSFTAVEVDVLASLVEPVTGVLRRCQADTFVPAAGRPRPEVGPVVLVLSPQLRVLGQTPQTAAYLRTLVPPAEGAAPIPASAYNVAAQLLAVEAGVDNHVPVARVHLAEGQWLALRAARIADDRPDGEQNIAVTIEAASPAERLSLFARACGLSARETELLGHVLAGATTKEVAARMFVSENTVQDHLKSIFAKTATRSRPALLSRVLGT